jgi:hypothetical protein
VYPLLPYLAKYGPALLRELRDRIDGPGWTHLLVPIVSGVESRQEGQERACL